MIRDLGTIAPGTTLYVPFHTFDSNDPSASVTLTGLATSDIEIYSNGSTTQRASDAGYALLDTDGIDFDGITGIHGLSINLADNTTAGFYAAGNQYWVVISSVTVDAATINFVLCTFRIGYPQALINTTIATLASQTSFTLTAGPAEDDALNGWIVIIHDVASAVQMGLGVVQDYTGSTRTVTLLAGVTFTAATTDNVSFVPPVNANYAGAVAYSTTRGLAGTALPAAAAEAAGGLYTRGTGAGQINQTNNGQIDADARRVGGTTQTGGDLAALLTTIDDFLDTEIAAILAAVDTEVAAILVDTAEIGVAGAGLTAVPWNAAWDAEVQSEVQDAIEANHLDHLLATTYDPAAKPGAADALLNELVESDAGVARYTANALEQAPTGGSAPTASAIADEVQTRTIAAVTTLVNAPSDSSGVTTLLGRLTATRAGYLDNLSAGAVATAAKLLSYFQSALRSDVTVDADIGGSYDDATDSQQAIRDNMGTAQTGDAYARLGAPAGASIAADIATRASQASVDTIDDLLDAEIAAILVDTSTTLDDFVDDLENRLTAALATKLAAHAAGVLVVAVGVGSTTTAVVLSTVEGAAPSATNDFYNGAVLILTSGTLAGQRTSVTDYDGGTTTLTVVALTGAPSNGVSGLLV